MGYFDNFVALNMVKNMITQDIKAMDLCGKALSLEIESLPY